jgi:CheY-like chemotaxis protein
MTRTLVVHHDPVVAQYELDSLAALGYSVEICRGPDVLACPLLAGRPCIRAERADILIYDLASLRHERGETQLVDELRALYADKPLIVVTGDVESGELEPVELAEGIVRLDGPITAERLDRLIEEALVDP